MCRVFGVSPSGFYAWHSREPSARAIEDAKLTARIRIYHARSKGAYGAPNILEDLREEGIRVGKKRVARLMKVDGLRGVCRRKFVITKTRDADAQPSADLVQRQFSADAPNRLWVADITYVPTWAGFLYLAVVLDAFSRRIVGWAMAEHLRTELVLSALNMAIGQRRAKALYITPTTARSTPRSNSGFAAKKPKSGPRWERWAMPTTTRCARASSPRSNASCLIAGALQRKPRRAWRSSSSLKAGTTRRGAIRASGESRPWSSNGVIHRIPSTRLPTGLRARLRLRRPARSLWITACDPSAKPSTETGQLQQRASAGFEVMLRAVLIIALLASPTAVCGCPTARPARRRCT